MPIKHLIQALLVARSDGWEIEGDCGRAGDFVVDYDELVETLSHNLPVAEREAFKASCLAH